MSKAALKKELLTFTGEQLVEVILNAYDSSKAAKDYFEFFLNPDAEALMEKKIDIIVRELVRVKRGCCKARISRIRAEIKEYASFGVGPEMVMRLMNDTIRMLTGQYARVNYTNTLINGTLRLVREYMAYADKNGMLTKAADDIRSIVDSDLGTRFFRKQIAEAASNLERR